MDAKTPNKERDIRVFFTSEEGTIMTQECIGLIGNGFVGSAINENLKNNYKFLIYDRKPDLANCKSIAMMII